MIFGHADLRKGESGAKFNAESDFDFHLAVAPQKPDQNSGKLIFRSKHFAENKIATPKNKMSGIV